MWSIYLEQLMTEIDGGMVDGITYKSGGRRRSSLIELVSDFASAVDGYRGQRQDTSVGSTVASTAGAREMSKPMSNEGKHLEGRRA
jgi:hypothetical protein